MSLSGTSLQHRYFHVAKLIQKYTSSLGAMTLGMPPTILQRQYMHLFTFLLYTRIITFCFVTFKVSLWALVTSSQGLMDV
jgi:hypothetical protein